jgi:hypothetical protein
MSNIANRPFARVKHWCNPGDAIASLAALKAFYQNTKSKVIFCQQLGIEANYYPTAVHDTTDDTGKMVCMNQAIWDMLQPLLLSQEYIHSTEEFVGQDDILIDLDVIRKKVFVNLPHGSIQSWVMFAFPDLAFNLSQPWITLPEADLPIIDQVKDKIIINFTERYRNGHINYYFLRKYKHKLLFAGTAREHLLFVNKWKIDMPKIEVNDFLELAYALKNCKFLLSNQSLNWNIAEAMKTPRVLELCEFAPNCMPFYGEKSYGFYHQQGLEYYCDLLNE